MTKVVVNTSARVQKSKDSKVHKILLNTKPEDIDRYVEDNITNLKDAKELLKELSKAVSYMLRKFD